MLPMSAKLTKRHWIAGNTDQNVINLSCFSDGTIIDSGRLSKFNSKWEK
jgi:hypothetical protein